MDPTTRNFLHQEEKGKGCGIRILHLAPSVGLVFAVATAMVLCIMMFVEDPQPKFIQNRGTGKCLARVGLEIKVQDCKHDLASNNNDDQHWWFVSVGGGDAHLLVSASNPSSCMEVEVEDPVNQTESGARIFAGHCSGNNNSAQNWGYSKDDVPKGSISIQNPSPGDDWDFDFLETAWCFQINGKDESSTNASEGVLTADCKDGQTNQQWDVVKDFKPPSLAREVAAGQVVGLV